MRSFFGIVEQVSYTFHGSEMMAPFRELLRPSNADQGKINWTNSLEVSFQKAKRAMAASMEEGVRIFDPDKPTGVLTDWSKRGIGHILTQKHCSCLGEDPGSVKLVGNASPSRAGSVTRQRRIIHR